MYTSYMHIYVYNTVNRDNVNRERFAGIKFVDSAQ